MKIIYSRVPASQVHASASRPLSDPFKNTRPFVAAEVARWASTLNQQRRPGLARAVGISCRLLVLLALSAPVETPVAAAQPGTAVLSDAAQVAALSIQEAKLARPVRLRAIVTYYDAARGFLFVQNKSTGLQVRVPQSDLPLARGQLVLIEGITAAVGNCVCVDNSLIQPLKATALPEAQRATIGEVLSGQFCSRLVEVEGAVSAIRSYQDSLWLQLHAGTNHLDIQLRDTPGAGAAELSRMLGSFVRVQGVAGSTAPPPNSKFSSPQLFVYSVGDILTLRAAPEPPFVGPLTDLGSVHSASDQRIKVMGRISSGLTNHAFVIESGPVRMRIRTEQALQARPGDLGEFVGFPTSEGSEWILDHAVCRLLDLSGSRQRPAVTNRLDWPASPFLPLIQEISSVLQLPPEEAGFRYPVRVRGIVTFWDPDYSYLFIENTHKGIFVALIKTNVAIKAGEIVEVTGHSARGIFRPTIVDARISIEALGELPAPVEWPGEHLMTGREDGNYIALEGVIHNASIVERHLWIELATAAGIVRTMILPGDDRATAEVLVDSRVRVRGVCGTEVDAQRQITGLRLYVQQLRDVEVRQAGSTNPFALPAIPISSLAQAQQDPEPGHRVRIRGVVTSQRRSSSFYVKQGSSPLWIELSQAQEVSPGDEVDVVGFPTLPGRPRGVESAVFRKVGTAPVPPPVALGQRVPSTRVLDTDFVSIDARLVDMAAASELPTLVMQAKSTVFEASFLRTNVLTALRQLKPGSLLRLTGIYSRQTAERGSSHPFRLLLTSEADVVVLQSPPWWTSRYAVTVANVLVGLIALAFSWAALLRRQVRRQTARIRQLNADLERRVAERTAELEAANRELESFSYSVSHDLRAPLRAVNGFAEILLHTHARQLDEKGSRYLRNVADGGRRMGRLVDDLLTFSRLGRQAIAKTTLDLNGLVAPVIEDLRAHEPLRQVEVQILDLPASEGDRGLVHQVLVNLLSNAWKFTG
ncbi:MAG: hypothetical protein QOF48_1049, partial [Verrucomicrobiota bacterium]